MDTLLCTQFADIWDTNNEAIVQLLDPTEDFTVDKQQGNAQSSHEGYAKLPRHT